MHQVKVVKARATNSLEAKINSVLEELIGLEIVDIKVTGAYDGDNESYIAVIIYRV